MSAAIGLRRKDNPWETGWGDPAGFFSMVVSITKDNLTIIFHLDLTFRQVEVILLGFFEDSLKILCDFLDSLGILWDFEGFFPQLKLFYWDSLKILCDF